MWKKIIFLFSFCGHFKSNWRLFNNYTHCLYSMFIVTEIKKNPQATISKEVIENLFSFCKSFCGFSTLVFVNVVVVVSSDLSDIFKDILFSNGYRISNNFLLHSKEQLSLSFNRLSFSVENDKVGRKFLRYFALLCEGLSFLARFFQKNRLLVSIFCLFVRHSFPISVRGITEQCTKF